MNVPKLSIPQKRFLLVPFIFSYLVAAVFNCGYDYGPVFYRVLSATCLFCMNIDGPGPPSFLRRTIGMGTLTATAYVLPLWIVFKIVQWRRQRLRANAVAGPTVL